MHIDSRCTYGSPRITVALKSRGILRSPGRIECLMRDNAIIAKTKRKFKGTTKSKPSDVFSSDFVKREFQSDMPNH